MAVPAAYLAIIVIWSTTPLALKWSGEGVGFLFGAVSRMTLGFVCVFAVAALRRELPRFDPASMRVYAASALGIYGAMLGVYWGAQFIPSGWIAIVFGLSPMFTAILSLLLLGERAFSASRVGAQLLGLAGLALIFDTGLALGRDAALGIAAIVLATVLHALSAVLVKRAASTLPAMSVVCGGLLFALVPYYLTWWLGDGDLPQVMPAHALGAILYLGIIATTLGFSLYYYVLSRQSATRVALITLVSPVTALMLGRLLNGEPVSARVLADAMLVLAALFVHEVLPALRHGYRRRAVPADAPRTA